MVGEEWVGAEGWKGVGGLERGQSLCGVEEEMEHRACSLVSSSPPLLTSSSFSPFLAQATLVGSSLALLTSSVVLFGLINTDMDADGMYGRSAQRPGPRQVSREEKG